MNVRSRGLAKPVNLHCVKGNRAFVSFQENLLAHCLGPVLHRTPLGQGWAGKGRMYSQPGLKALFIPETPC